MDTQKTTLPPAVIRLLPKKNTFRLITNLRKRFLIKVLIFGHQCTLLLIYY